MPAADTQKNNAQKGEGIAMIDGDACGTTPMFVEVVPNAVNILTPRKG
jgi:diacylglycerol kinase family enzyme